jgi:peptidoglycan/xylan/chitin deacetylase (PgdA/CDA1 family)
MAGSDAVADLADRGHEIGLHTHDHAPLWQMNAAALTSDIKKTEQRTKA